MEHALNTIATMGSRPMQKQPMPTEGMDARMLATTLVARVLVECQQQHNVWQGFAIELIKGTTDFRAAFLKQMGEQLKEMRAKNVAVLATLGKDGSPNPTKDETKLGGKRVATATVYISKLRGIAVAFNGAATVEGLITHHAESGRVKPEGVTLESIGFTVMDEYAAQFRESKAGRKADPFKVKFAKWLEGAGSVGEDASDADKAHHAQALAFLATLKD